MPRGRPALRHPTAAEIASHADTLNHALGRLGGKQRAWATAASGTHPEPHPVPYTGLPEPSRAADRTHHREQPASNSTSPQLPNVLWQKQRVPSLPSPAAVSPPAAILPSPSPSEEAAIDRHRPVPTPTNHSAVTPADGAHATYTPLAQYGASEYILRPPDARVINGGEPVVSAPKRPAGPDITGPDKRSRGDDTARPVPARSMTQPTLPSRPDPRRASLNTPFLGLPQAQYYIHQVPGAPSPTQASSPHNYGIPVLHSSALAPPAHGSNLPPPGVLSDRASNPTLQGHVPGQPSPTTTTSHPEDALFNNLHIYLTTFLNTSPLIHQHQPDGKRITTIREALNRRDWCYLTMHQYYCLASIDYVKLPARVRVESKLRLAIQVLSSVLGENKDLFPSTLHFLANFPMLVHQQADQFPELHEAQVSAFVSFVVLSPKTYALFERPQRDYPPLARELANTYGIASPIFQQLAFRSILRRLSSSWGDSSMDKKTHLEEVGLKFFVKDQSEFYALERVGNQGHGSVNDCTESPWEMQLRQFCDSYRNGIRENAAGVPPPHPQVPVTAQFLSQQILQVPLHNQNAPQVVLPQASFQSRSQVQSNPMFQVTFQRGPHGPLQTIPYHTSQLFTQSAHGAARGQTQDQGPGRGQVQVQAQIQAQGQASGQGYCPRSHTSSSLQRPQKTPLLPAAGVMLPVQREPQPSRFCLHQANVRSPLLQAQNATESPLYLYCKGFLRPPMRLSDAGRKIESWTFTWSSEDFRCMPNDQISDTGAPPTRLFNEQSQMLRLRCIKWPGPVLPDEHTWATTETSWIPHSYFTLNGVDLVQRKKQYYGKDLPIDLTPHARKGVNTLDIAVLARADDQSYRKFLVAVEILAVKSHAAIIHQSVTANHVSAATTAARLGQKLKGASDENDDISIVESSLTISLLDPFNASRMCDRPARGRGCLHFECFDLETFLKTRKRRGDASAADHWKCPICNGDARPQHLIIDGFFEEVRRELERQGLPETRAIVVDQQGSWQPKPRDPNGVRDSLDNDNDSRSEQRRTSVQPIVIDLSD